MIAQHWDFRRLRALAPGFVVVSLFLLVAVLAVAPAVNGARRWIARRAGRLPAVRAREARARDLGRELPLAPPAAAHARRAREAVRPARLPSSRALIVLEPDLGTAIAIVLMLVRDAARRGHAARALLGLAFAIAGAAGIVAIWLEPYRRARFFAFLHPWDDAQGSGFQIVQAMIGMGSGGIFGVGLGQGVQKIFYLPEAPTDMMLANIGEELGLIGVTGVLAAYVLFAYAGFRIALALPRPVRQAARRRADGARLRPGRGQRLRPSWASRR